MEHMYVNFITNHMEFKQKSVIVLTESARYKSNMLTFLDGNLFRSSVWLQNGGNHMIYSFFSYNKTF